VERPAKVLEVWTDEYKFSRLLGGQSTKDANDWEPDHECGAGCEPFYPNN